MGKVMSEKDNRKNFLEFRKKIIENYLESNSEDYNEGFSDENISELIKELSEKFIQILEKEIITDGNIKNGLDWRNITTEDIDNGAGIAYGNNLKTGNYISPVKNQHVPTYSGTCWIFSTVSIYSNTYKIAQVASGEKNILNAELGRRNLSVQYICDWLGC